MDKNFDAKNDNNTQKVLEYLYSSKIDLNRFEMKKFNDFPGGIELINSKGKSIVFYYNYLIGSIEKIYKDLGKYADELYFTINLLMDMQCEPENFKTKIICDKIDEDHIRFSRVKKGYSKLIEVSRVFDMNNELYEIYEYLEEQIKYFTEDVLPNKLKTL